MLNSIGLLWGTPQATKFSRRIVSAQGLKASSSSAQIPLNVWEILKGIFCWAARQADSAAAAAVYGFLPAEKSALTTKQCWQLTHVQCLECPLDCHIFRVAATPCPFFAKSTQVWALWAKAEINCSGDYHLEKTTFYGQIPAPFLFITM